MPKKSETTHVLLENQLIIYQRERSRVWQCRFKVDRIWQRASTKESDLKKAREAAHRLLIEAEFRKRENLPVVTRKFRDIAKLAIERMNKEIASGSGKVSYIDYIRCINDYLIPCLSKRSITNIDHTALDELDTFRVAKMGKAPTHSTLQTHNSALNRVFDEAVIRNFLTEANRPKLESKGKSSERRPAFEMHELQALLGNFDSWFDRARTKDSKELRQLMRDYVEILIDTGARPGVEIMNLKWRQIKFVMSSNAQETNNLDEEAYPIISGNLQRSCQMNVTGKTGTRTIVGMLGTVKALQRIALRNYDIKDSITNPFKQLTVPTNEDYVIQTRNKKRPTSFQKLFIKYLTEHNLLVDPITEQVRVFYSLRHTYATFALTYDRISIHTLAKQMGTSVLMIEKHYSHLKVTQAIEQLRGEETRKLIRAGGIIDEIYTSNLIK